MNDCLHIWSMHAEIRRVNECWGGPREWEKAQRKRVAVIWWQTCTFRLKIKLVSSFRHESLGSLLSLTVVLLLVFHATLLYLILFLLVLLYIFCFCFFFYVATSFHSISFPHDALPFQRFFVEREYLEKKSMINMYLTYVCMHFWLITKSFSFDLIRTLGWLTLTISFSHSVQHMAWKFFVWKEKCIRAI